jgi:parallel beta-helix repeat protein
MNANHTIRMAFVFVLGLTIFPVFALAGSIVVAGSCKPTLPSYPTLTAAVAGAPDGGTIQVCPGSYTEQVTIAKNLTINGIASGNAGLPTIVVPAGGLVQNATTYNVTSGFLQNSAVAAQIIVAPGATVNFNGITIDATNNGLPNCGPVPIGIYYSDSSGTVDHVQFRNQLATCFYDGFAGAMAYPMGDGVFVQSDGTLPASVTVENSSFHLVGYMGVHADGADASVSIKDNTVEGPGITYGNGILVEWGAGSPSISGNYETNALLSTAPSGFWGILLNSCAGGTVVSSNVISNSSNGIVAECNGNTITGNKIFASEFDGIEVCGSNNVVQSNMINDSGQSGVNLVQGCLAQNNTVSANTVVGACAGVLEGTDATGNTIGTNTLFNVQTLLLSGGSCI